MEMWTYNISSSSLYIYILHLRKKIKFIPQHQHPSSRWCISVSNDCLYLYVPKNRPSRTFPVTLSFVLMDFFSSSSLSMTWSICLLTTLTKTHLSRMTFSRQTAEMTWGRPGQSCSDRSLSVNSNLDMWGRPRRHRCCLISRSPSSSSRGCRGAPPAIRSYDVTRGDSDLFVAGGETGHSRHEAAGHVGRHHRHLPHQQPRGPGLTSLPAMFLLNFPQKTIKARLQTGL